MGHLNPNRPSLNEIEAFFVAKNARAQITLLNNYYSKVKKIEASNLSAEGKREEIAKISTQFGSQSMIVKDCYLSEKNDAEIYFRTKSN